MQFSYFMFILHQQLCLADSNLTLHRHTCNHTLILLIWAHINSYKSDIKGNSRIWRKQLFTRYVRRDEAKFVGEELSSNIIYSEYQICILWWYVFLYFVLRITDMSIEFIIIAVLFLFQAYIILDVFPL